MKPGSSSLQSRRTTKWTGEFPLGGYGLDVSIPVPSVGRPPTRQAIEFWHSLLSYPAKQCPALPPPAPSGLSKNDPRRRPTKVLMNNCRLGGHSFGTRRLALPRPAFLTSASAIMNQVNANRLFRQIAHLLSAHLEEPMIVCIISSVLESHGRLRLWKC